MKSRRRNDGPWRDAVMEARGEICRACGGWKNVQADHIKERSQGGKNDVENGLPLCGPFHGGTSEFADGCHAGKTAGKLLIERDWLDDDQVEYLARIGWVTWNDDGEPVGYGCRSFAPVRSRREEETHQPHQSRS